MKRVLITGAGGGIGRSLRETLRGVYPVLRLSDRITLPAADVARLKDIRLVPGMPVEAFIQTHERSPLQYLLKPLRDQIARTFRER